MKPVPFKGTAKYIVYGEVNVFRYDSLHEQHTQVTGKCESKDDALHHLTGGGGGWWSGTAALILTLSA
jgi:hypothetical protein